MKQYHKNPRQITDKQFKKLNDTLLRLGDLSGIVHDLNSDEIIGGNQRARAFNINDCEIVIEHELPESDEQGSVAFGYVIWQGKRYAYRAVRWTPAQCEEANIVANKAGGSWDFDILANEFEIGDLFEWGFEPFEFGMVDGEQQPADADAEPQVNRADELREEWQVETGQMWRLPSRTAGQEHRLICGDCTDAAVVERVMGGERADAVFTSPPYAVGVDYGDTYQDSIGNLRAILPAIAKSAWSVLVDGGFCVINYGDIVSGGKAAGVDGVCEYPMALEYWPVFRATGFVLWSRRVWCKPVARVAAPWCASSNRSATNYEHMWTWKKDGAPIVGRVAQPMDSQSGWFDTSRLEGVGVGKNTHGAGMPTSAAEWMLNVHSRNGTPVHEPFCGTGTTIIAAENLSRQCRAVEISEAYTAVSLQRYLDAFGIRAELVDA